MGFYGLDLYSLHASMEAVLAYLDKVDPEAAGRARARYACFDHYGEDTQAYGFASGLGLGPSCEHEVVSQLVDLRRSAAEYALRDGRIAEDDYFYAEQNARLVRDAEQYYRTMYRGEVSSWNLRDRHMAETLDALVDYLGQRGGIREDRGVGAQLPPGRRAGDADGGPRRVERRPARARAVRPRRGPGRLHDLRGHGDGRLELGRAGRAEAGPAGAAGSYEALFHDVGPGRFLLCLRDDERVAGLREPRLERAIGVIYRPETERASHYFHASLPAQFDAVLHFDRTRAVEPLERTAAWEAGEVPETFPTGI